MLVDVIEARRRSNLQGHSRWRLTLACGHEREIAATKGRRQRVRVPKRVKCFECSKAVAAQEGGDDDA